MPNDVIEQPSFSVTPHARGPILVVLQNGTVIMNLRLDAATNWALERALKDAHEAQCRLDTRRSATEES
jgi:hypothetical protein